MQNKTTVSGILKQGAVALLLVAVLVVVVFWYSPGFVSAVRPSGGQWEVQPIQAEATPAPRFGHTITEVDGQLYMFGGALAAPDLQQLAGSATANVSSELWRWDKAGEKWVAVNPPSSPPARHGHAAATSDRSGQNKMYVFNGAKADGSLHSDIWSYNPATMKCWTLDK